jgi:hypothetical protein
MAFLQYKTETIPGKPLKRKVTQEETRERKKQYENVNLLILGSRTDPWLHHNVEQNVMLVHRSQDKIRKIRKLYLNSVFVQQ